MTDDLSMKVQFTQTFTLHPPDSIEDAVEADCWFHENPAERLYDAMDVNQGDIEVLEIND